MRVSKVICVLIIGLSAVVTSAQNPNITFAPPSFSTATTSSSLNIQNTGVGFFKLVFIPTGSPASCQVQVDTSIDGASWNSGDAIASTACTGSGSVVGASAVYNNFARINVTALTASTSVFVILQGFIGNPATFQVTGTGTANSVAVWTSATALGTKSLTDTGSLVTSTSSVRVPAGSCSAPSLNFTGATTSGLGQDGSGNPCVVTAGTQSVVFQNSGMFINTANSITWNNDLWQSRVSGASGPTALGIGSTQGSTSGSMLLVDGNKVVLTADWTCGTTGTVASCNAAPVIIGSGGGVPMTFTLPLSARSYQVDCDFVVGQATAAVANTWSWQTATNGATNVTSSYIMATAATAMAVGATTDTASTTTATAIAPNWTLGGTATKMPVRLHFAIEGASASGTVFSVLLTNGANADLITIYRGGSCHLY